MLLAVVSILLSFVGHCQDTTMPDAQDWLVQKKVLRSRISKGCFLFMLPVVGSNPAAGFVYGAGLTYVSEVANRKGKVSNLSSNASYSVKGFANLNVKTNLFKLNDRLFLNGDWRFFVIAETTYGLGPKGTDQGEAIRYGLWRFHETGSWKIVTNLYAGIGIHFDQQFRIDNDIRDSGDVTEAYQYQYSLRHGFSPRQYNTSGFSLNVLFDSRDNPINTYKGYYININYRINTIALGSAQNSSLWLADCRAFFPLDGKFGRHV
ncbi:MAG: hypothetical protein JST42_03130, partial [Bacteroidetes bacterium]|nr:hypothetical protein [Bacteroidota bacterium]